MLLELKLFLLIVVAASSVVTGVLAGILALNAIYKITKKEPVPDPRPFILWIIFYFSFSITGILGPIVVFVPVTESDPIIDYIEYEAGSDNIAMFNTSGSVMGRIEIDGLISKAEFVIDSDGNPRIVVSTNSEGENPGTVFVFGKEKELLCEFNSYTGRDDVVEIPGLGQTGKFTIKRFFCG